MNGAQPEVTERINRDELLRLLDTMTPPQQQTITSRASIAEIEAELGRVRGFAPAVPLAPLAPAPPVAEVAATVAAVVAAAAAEAPVARGRKYPRPFSQVAAMLPSVSPTRRPPRITQPLPSLRASTATDSLAIPERKAPRTLSELRAQLDGELAAGPMQHAVAQPALSARVVAELTAEDARASEVFSLAPQPVAPSPEHAPASAPILAPARRTADPSMMWIAAFVLAVLFAAFRLF